MASSRQSTAPAKSSSTTSPEPRATSTSSPTRSTSTTTSTVVLALGSNLGNREYHLRRAVHALSSIVRVVRVSSMLETAAVDAPADSPPFLNVVLVGFTALPPASLLAEILALESRLGRVRRGVRNEPRVIDIDLILHGATRMRTRSLTLPHPRAHEREFVMVPLREVAPFPLSPQRGERAGVRGGTGHTFSQEPPLTLALSPRCGERG